MAQNTTITLPDGVWTLITDSDIASLTAQNQAEVGGVYLQGTVGAVPPTDGDLTGAQFLAETQTVLNETLADLFPGVSGANRVYALPEAGAGRIRVSHA